MGFLGTGAHWTTDALILAEILISALVVAGILLIRRGRRVSKHRVVMLGSLGLNALFLVGFLVQDLLRASNVVERNPAPGYLFWPLLGVHLAIALSAVGVAVVAWRVARRGMVRSADGRLDLAPGVRVAHRRIALYYPWLWGFTLGTGLLLYALVYLLY